MHAREPPFFSSPTLHTLQRMLCRDVSKRLTAAQLLKHPWMKANGVASEEEVTPEVLSRLRTFGKMNNFKKEALKVRV